ncbi:glutaredoxin [Ornithinimicrobium kibberense]|uniref:Glutaredoxin n=1 Tax=Ornithinimicrobium kibberense TaxID=282060 RepID=A0ABV5V3S3_9MICO|nr:glutaredoxin [Ornithinimicrobium kibberense]
MTTTSTSRPVQIEVVDSPGCHSCDETHRVLSGLKKDGYLIEVRSFDARTAPGQDRMQEHRAGLTPLVLVDGAFFSQGGVSRRELITLLEN